MLQLRNDTTTVVAICAFGRYDMPDPARRPGRLRLAELERVGPAVARLQALLASAPYRRAGIETVALQCASRAELKERLAALREAVRAREGVHMVLFWSGHGGLDGGAFRLATPDTHDPIEQEDGVGLDEVARDAGIARVRSWTLLLDACHAGAGFGDVVAAVNRQLMGEAGQLRGFGALFACAPYERARDSVFLNTVVDVLEHGPSQAARDFGERQGGGGVFNPFNRLLSVAELFEAVPTEYLADPVRFRKATPPVPVSGGAPRLFPNPQYRPQQPSRLVEDALRAIARRADLEGHFFPKALGLDHLEVGWHFSGRVEATRDILDWMDAAEAPALYVLAADGGTGKSALLGRLVALTDPDYRARAQVQGWDEAADRAAGTVPAPDRIDAALNLRQLTAQAAADHLAGILGIAPTDSVERFAQASVAAYRRADGRPPCLVLDALDEAEDPAAVVQRVVLPLAQAGWKLLVATRPTARARGAGELLAMLGDAQVRRLDRDAHSQADIQAYAAGRLRRHAPLAAVADTAARTIAERADGKFLYARMASSALLRNAADVTPGNLDRFIARNAAEALSLDVAELDAAYRLRFGRAEAGASAMLAALAWAQGEGVPLRDGLWAAMAAALACAQAATQGPASGFDDAQLLWLLREAGRYIQEAGDGEQAVYRLFHKSLAEHFLERRAPAQADEERLAQALVACVRASLDWRDTNPYLVRHMPAHLAARPGQKGLNQLLANFDWIRARLAHGGVHALLHDYLYCDAAWPATARLHRTLSMVAHILQADPGQLVPQLLGRIAPGVPDLRALLDSRPGANYGLPPPGRDGLDATQRMLLQAPDLEIERAGPGLLDRTVRLDGLLQRARASLVGPRWVPEPGGLAQAGPLVGVLKGHAGGVAGVAVCAPAGTIVSGGKDGVVRVWDARTCALLRQLQAGAADVQCLAASADGRTVACGGLDGRVRLFDLQADAPVQSLQGHGASVCCVAVSADGQTVASGDVDGEVRLWSVHGSAPLRVLRGGPNEVRGVALSADGRRFAWGSGDDSVRAGTLDDAAPPRKLPLRAGARCVALSADGRTVAAGDSGGSLYLWEGPAAAPRMALAAHGDAVGALALSPDGTLLVSGGWDYTLRVTDARRGTSLRAWQTLRGHESFITCVAVSPDGKTIASGGFEDGVRVWDAQVGSVQPVQAGHASWVYGLAASPDGRLLASGGGDGSVRTWDAVSGAPLRELPGPDGLSVFCVALSADGRTLVAAGSDQAVRVWVPGVALWQVLHGHTGWINGVALAPDGRTVVSGADDKTVRLWDAASGAALRTLQMPGQVNAMVLSPDGATLLAGCHDGSVSVWDLRSGRPLRTLHQAGWVRSLALGPGGAALASGSVNGMVRLWDLPTGALRAELRAHEGMVFSLAFSADGRSLVSSGQDGSVQVRDAGSGVLLERLDLGAAVHAVAWCRDAAGQPALAAACGSAIVRLVRVG